MPDNSQVGTQSGTAEIEFSGPALSGKSDAKLFVRRMIGTEELGRLPSYDIDLLYRRKETSGDFIDPTDMLGKTACITLTVESQQSTKRHFHGYITHFERDGAEASFDVYRITLRPWLWYLTKTTDCRIFARKTALEIIQEVFQDYGAAVSFQNKVQTTLHKREYTVQYRESDFAFVSRLMEQEGLYYYFTHDQNSHTMVLCEGSTEHPVIIGPSSTLGWSEGLAADEDDAGINAGVGNVITRWRRTRSVQPVSYSHTDYDAEAPSSDLAGTHQRDVTHDLVGQMDQFDYPGLHDDLAQTGDTGSKKSEGNRQAQLKVAGYKARSDVATGVTPSRAMAVGFQFTLSHHEDAGDFLVTHTEVHAEFAGYEGGDASQQSSFSCRFEALAASTQFQPHEYTEPPLISGTQTGVVVAMSDGDEIATEKLGRVKVRFRWDRKQASKTTDTSCWVRVLMPWASAQFGFFALPRVGDEVVVQFLEGNPDRPIIIGSVYNGTNTPPYTLPDHATVSGIKTRSSKQGGADNFNELRFDDAKGSEYIWFQAEKDYNQFVKNDSYVYVKHNATHVVDNDSQTKIGKKMILDVGDKTTIHLAADASIKLDHDCNAAVGGALNLAVTKAAAIKLSDAAQLTVGQGLDLNVGQGTNLTSGAAVNIKANSGVVIDGSTQLTIQAGGSFIVLGPSGVTISGAITQVNSGGSAGNAQSASSASPAAPDTPSDPPAQQDPLAS